VTVTAFLFLAVVVVLILLGMPIGFAMALLPTPRWWHSNISVSVHAATSTWSKPIPTGLFL